MAVPSQPGQGGEPLLDPGVRERGLRRYVRVLRENWWVILLAVLVTTLAAFAYSLKASKSYTAAAVLEVRAVASDNTTFVGLPVIQSSSDPTRDVQSVSAFVETNEVRDEAAHLLKAGGEDFGGLGSRISAVPVAGSSYVSVTGTAGNAASAARVANAAVDATVKVREQQLSAALEPKIKALQQVLNATPDTTTNLQVRQATVASIAQLEALRNQPDPSVLISTRATSPTHASGPGTKTILLVGAFIGLFLGVAAAFAFETLLSRVRNERQLLENFNVPILARVPLVRGRGAGSRALAPEQLNRPAVEAYRTLRQNIGVLRRDPNRMRTLVFTSSGPAEGKTTSALNTAAALAEAGHRVILVDADVRRPSLGATLSISPSIGVTTVLSGGAELEDALVVTSRYGGRLGLLLVSPGEPARVEVITKPAIERLVHDAAERADFLIFDTPPLGTVADALPMVVAADDVFVTVRRSHTNMAALQRLTATLWRAGARLRGFVFVGAEKERVAYGSLYEERGPLMEDEPLAPPNRAPGKTGGRLTRWARSPASDEPEHAER